MGPTSGSGVVGFFVIVAVFCVTIGLVALFITGLVKRNATIWITTGILLTPLLILTTPLAYQLIRHDMDRRITDAESRPISWAYMCEDLNSLINTFYLENPDLFTFPNNDEAPSSPELLALLAASDVFTIAGFSIQDGSIISPFGDYVRLLVDRDRNGLFTANNYVRANPWPEQRYICLLVRQTSLKEPNREGWERQN